MAGEFNDGDFNYLYQRNEANHVPTGNYIWLTFTRPASEMPSIEGYTCLGLVRPLKTGVPEELSNPYSERFNNDPRYKWDAIAASWVRITTPTQQDYAITKAALNSEPPVESEKTDAERHMDYICVDMTCPIHSDSNYFWSNAKDCWVAPVGVKYTAVQDKPTRNGRTPNPFKLDDILVKASDVSIGDGTNRQRYEVLETISSSPNGGTDILVRPVGANSSGIWARHEDYLKV